jgi:signal transduction histidine kinase/ActR/RegA family two-component response regulator
VTALAEDRTGRVWIGTPGGLNYLEGDSFGAYTRAEGLPENHIRCIYEDDGGKLWLGFHHRGLACIDGDTISCYTTEDGLFHHHVETLIQDREGLIWCAHPQVGLSRLDIVSTEPLCSLPVTETLVKDSKGRLWFGSENDIVCIEPDGSIKTAVLRYRVYDVAEDRDGSMWVATGGCGLLHLPSAEAIFEAAPLTYRVPEVGPDDIISLLFTREGHLLIGTANPGQIYLYDKSSFECISTRNTAVFRMLEDDNGLIWFAGGGSHWAGPGLGCLERGRLTYFGEADGLPSDAVKTMLLDDRSRLWIGTQYGLCVKEEGQIRGVDEGSGTPINHQCMLQDSKGHFWFGTIGAGAYCYDGRQFQQLTTDDGLPSNNVSGLLACDDGSVIIGTYRGLVRYRSTASRPPLLEIRKVLADRVYVSPTSLELTTTQTRLLTVVFQATSLAANRFRYSYVLEGYDQEWRDTWSTEVTYNNLPVGDYVFRVHASNRDFVYSETAAEITFKVVADPVSQLLAEHQEQLGRMQAEIKTRARSERLHRALIDLVRSKTIEEEELHPALNRITEVASEALETDWTSVWLCDQRHTRLQCIDHFQTANAHHSRGENVVLVNGLADLHGVTHDRVVCADSCLGDDRLVGLPEQVLPRQRITSALVVSVWHAGRFAGLVVSAQKNSKRIWTTEEANFAAFLSDYVALALERAERRRAERALRASQDEERAFQLHLLALHELGNELGRLESFDEVCRAAVDEGCKRLGFESLSLWLKGNAEDELLASYATDEFGHVCDRRGERGLATAPWLFGRPARELAGAELITDAPLYNASGEFVRMGARAVAALWDGEEVTGFLVTDNLARGKAINEHQCELLGLFASALGHLASRRRADEERRRLEAQVQQSQRLESLGVLAGGIAHDFNNILAAIFGHITLALEEVPRGSSLAENMQQVLRAGGRAKELVQQILAFSRHSEQAFRPIALDLIVEETLQFARASLPSTVEIVRNIAVDSAYMLGNATQLHQVVMNLCTNASQALGKDGGTLEVSLEAVEWPNCPDNAPKGDTGCIRLTVRDSGCGMPPEIVSRIFEPFFTTKAPGEGTGMGLSVVHGIVTSHGGIVRVESMPDVGTAFHIYFPRTAKPQEEIPVVPVGQSRGTERVLFVDDEDSLVNLARKLLGNLGYEITTACNGAEALKIFAEDPDAYDMVITDRLMPRMTGDVLAQELKMLRPELPVLLTTGHFDDVSAEQLEELGISAVLIKPYSIQEFSSAVRHVLDRNLKRDRRQEAAEKN